MGVVVGGGIGGFIIVSVVMTGGLLLILTFLFELGKLLGIVMTVEGESLEPVMS